VRTRTLVPPPIGRAYSTIRAEALPFYYANSRFDISYWITGGWLNPYPFFKNSAVARMVREKWDSRAEEYEVIPAGSMNTEVCNQKLRTIARNGAFRHSRTLQVSCAVQLEREDYVDEDDEDGYFDDLERMRIKPSREPHILCLKREGRDAAIAAEAGGCEAVVLLDNAGTLDRTDLQAVGRELGRCMILLYGPTWYEVDTL
jgi:hypothetical protein